MILRDFLCALSLCITLCSAVPTGGFGQESAALAEADQDFQKALKIWGYGRSAEAEALLNRALATRLEQLGPNDPKVAQVIERLGALAFNRAKYAEAEKLFRKALDIDIKALGEKSAAVAYLMGDVGAALREQRRYGEAKEIVERSLALRRELLPANDLAIAGSLNNLGRIFLGEYQYADARRAFEESLRISTASLPRDHPRVIEGQTLLKFAETAEASAAYSFVKVFDVLDSGFRDWTFPAFGLIFVVFGVIIFAFPKIIKTAGVPYLPVKSGVQTFFRYSFLGFAILWTSMVFFTTYSQHLRHKALAQENGCRVVVGPVEHFVPMPYTGHAEESFSVAGVPFRYSDFIITDGFNNTSSHGGPINADSYVRICYDPSGNVILRLEIRDFKGDLKDYSKVESIFPTLGDTQNIIGKNIAINISWYSNLFIVFYILDLVAIRALFLPYVRTFFRLKTATVRDCPISMALEAGRKIKLRNSMIYWDNETRTIWLRPRGFNFVQIPFTVAKLGVDAGGKAVIGYEIRFSSGFPFVTVLFFWTAYVFFSATMPADPNFPLPAMFVGGAGLMFLIVGFFKLGTLRSRLKKVVEDALSEIRANG
jgi:tetratricopeptide (TPR) repeat protein